MYEIILDGPYGREEVDCELTLKEAREYVKEYRMSDPSQHYGYRRQKQTRFYVKPSAGMRWFGPEEVRDIVKKAGGKNVRTAMQFGWSNQPDVLTFSGYSAEERDVKNALEVAGIAALVLVKDWR